MYIKHNCHYIYFEKSLFLDDRIIKFVFGMSCDSRFPLTG